LARCREKPFRQTTARTEFAQAFDAVDKIIVFSQSLDSAEGEKTRIVHTGLHDEVLKLKQGQGKNIMTGGVTLASQLAELGLMMNTILWSPDNCGRRETVV